MKRNEVKYFVLIIVVLWLGVTGYNTLLKSPEIALPQAAQLGQVDSEQQAFAFPGAWVGSAKLSSLLGVELSGFVKFKSDQNDKVSVFHNIGVENPIEVPIESMEEVDQSTTITWAIGYDSYEFQILKEQQEASLFVTRNGVRYFVLMNSYQSYLQMQSEETTATSRFIDNTVVVLIEMAELLLPIWIVLIISYGVIAGLMYLAFWKLFRKAFSNRKIQTKLPQKGAVSFEVKHSLIAALAIGFFSFLLVWLIASGYSKSYAEISDYGWAYWAFSLVLLLVLVDAYVYWTHRLMHHRLFFSSFHKIHHHSNRPTPWSTWSMNVNEVIVNALFVPIVILVVPLHELTLIVFSVISIVKNILNHAGFEVFPRGANKSGILKWIVTPTYHEMHHMYFNSNYSAFFTWWDKWMGTEHETYDELFEKTHSTTSRVIKGIQSRG